MGTQSTLGVPRLGELLRYWRQERGKSQLDLSLDSGISQRHLSFVESGRSAPSRDFLSIVSEALNIPLRERNVLLLASGYAPLYSEQSMDAEQMAIVTRAIGRMPAMRNAHVCTDLAWSQSCRWLNHLDRSRRSLLLTGASKAMCWALFGQMNGKQP